MPSQLATISGAQQSLVAAGVQIALVFPPTPPHSPHPLPPLLPNTKTHTPHTQYQSLELLVFVHCFAALFITLDTGTTLDAETRRTLKRRLNPVLDLASAAEDRLTADGYGLAHNAARSEVVGD